MGAYWSMLCDAMRCDATLGATLCEAVRASRAKWREGGESSGAFQTDLGTQIRMASLLPSLPHTAPPSTHRSAFLRVLPHMAGCRVDGEHSLTFAAGDDLDERATRRDPAPTPRRCAASLLLHSACYAARLLHSLASHLHPFHLQAAPLQCAHRQLRPRE